MSMLQVVRCALPVLARARQLQGRCSHRAQVVLGLFGCLAQALNRGGIVRQIDAGLFGEVVDQRAHRDDIEVCTTE